MKEDNRRILQIIPADGWWAEYDGTTDPDRNIAREGFLRLVCWVPTIPKNRNVVIGDS
jgi:hypothetical protein